MAAIKNTMPIKYRQPWLITTPLREGIVRLASLAGDGQFIFAPLIPTMGINLDLLKPTLAKLKSAIVAFAAVDILAINHNRLRLIQLRLQGWKTRSKLCLGQVD